MNCLTSALESRGEISESKASTGAFRSPGDGPSFGSSASLETEGYSNPIFLGDGNVWPSRLVACGIRPLHQRRPIRKFGIQV